MLHKQPITICWFRRDLRLYDNTALFHALNSTFPVLPLFIFEKNILDQLEDEDDCRVTFIYDTLSKLNDQLKEYSSSFLILHDTAEKALDKVLADYNVQAIFANEDYEPYATRRDSMAAQKLRARNIPFYTFKDQVIFGKKDVLKDDGTPYTVYSPYMRKWFQQFSPQQLRAQRSENLTGNFVPAQLAFPSLTELGFRKSSIEFPTIHFQDVISDYSATRDFPAIEGTSRISVHLRFGTVSIRTLVAAAMESADKVWLKELIWREFYMMILWHFPHTATSSFKPKYDLIGWRNDTREFRAWCEGRTGYPLVDAGMRQLNETAWMHNRVRMVAASFLTKHLLIDWRWGEAYFARKLMDYEQASNVGGWQWAAGSGTDAVPYFRIFNPKTQAKNFDPSLEYIRRFVPEFDDPFKYPSPIVDHKAARERALKTYQQAVGNPT